MGGGDLYVPEVAPEVPNLYSNMLPLLQQQEYIHNVHKHPDCASYGTNPLALHIDLDRHREHRERGRVNMVHRYFDVFRISEPTPDQWLTVQGPRLIASPYTLVNVTPRFRDHSKVNWNKVVSEIEGPIIFVGTTQEALQFPNLMRVSAANALELALLVKYADAVYCNQSFVFALAVAQGKKVYLEQKRGKTNCLGFNNLNVLQ